MGVKRDGRPSDPGIPTTTHARLRAEQGDVETARNILHAILAARPADVEARELLARLADASGSGHDEPTDDPPLPPLPAQAKELASRFKEALGGRQETPARRFERRLREMLGSIQAMRGERGAR